jgi:hypothetical protein
MENGQQGKDLNHTSLSCTVSEKVEMSMHYFQHFIIR